MISDKLIQDSSDPLDFNLDRNEFVPAGEMSIDLNAFAHATPAQAQGGGLARALNNPVPQQHVPQYPQQQPHYPPQYPQQAYYPQQHQQHIPQPQYAPQYPPQQPVQQRSFNYSAAYYDSCLVFTIDAPGLVKEDIKIIPEDMSITVSYRRSVDFSEFDSMYGHRQDMVTNVPSDVVSIPIRLKKIVESVKWSYKNGIIAVTAMYRQRATVAIEEG